MVLPPLQILADIFRSYTLTQKQLATHELHIVNTLPCEIQQCKIMANTAVDMQCCI